MSGNTVTLCIEDDNRRPIPLAVVPFEWVQKYQGNRKFTFPVPDSDDSTVEISVDVIQLRVPSGEVKTTVNLWIKSGAESLVNHPLVATYPLARAKIVTGMN